MKSQWQVVPMKELCSIKSGKSDSQDANEKGEYAFFDRSKKIKRSTRYLYDCEALIIPGEGAEFLPRHFVGKFDLHQRAYALFNFSDRIDVRFLFYFLTYFKDYFERVAVGATVKSLRLRHFEDLPVAITEFEEQKRIVTILDEVFETIATARANTEKNLQNARVLFESHLQSVFESDADDWTERSLGEFAEFRNGINYTKGSTGACVKVVGVSEFQKNYWIPLGNLQSVSIDGKLNVLDELRQNDILVVRSNGNPALIGRCMVAGVIAEKITHSGFTIRIRLSGNEVDAQYLNYFMKSQGCRRSLVDGGTGISIKSLNQGTLSALVVPFPKKSEQLVIVNRLNRINEESHSLQSIYQDKITALDELKKALLHRAFSGELTKHFNTAAVIPFPAMENDMQKMELHAGLLAMAYQLHEKHGRQKYLGHVKAEKTAHLIEFLVGVDLGRDAYKDAAGPNDFARLKDVEEYAEQAGYFSFKQIDGGRYVFNKFPQFESLVARTRQALGERCADVDRLLELMLPMDKRKAELFATIYAAWNNLLLLKKPVSDEDIVRESRDDWHPDKMAIPREEFFATLAWIRKNDVIPQGKGKPVGFKKDPGELLAGLNNA